MPGIGDIVAVYIDDKPSAYARIEDITRDIKSHWFQVRLLFLSFPAQETTWILRKEYLEGSSFSMKDLPMRIVPLAKPGSYANKESKRPRSISGEVISMENMRKKMKHKKPDTD